MTNRALNFGPYGFSEESVGKFPLNRSHNLEKILRTMQIENGEVFQGWMQGSDITGHIWETCNYAIILDELILSKFVKTIFIIYLVVKAWCREEINFILVI